MPTISAKARPLETRHGFALTTSLPPTYQLAIEDTPFQLTVLDNFGEREVDCDGPVAPPTWFAVTVTASTRKRYLYLVQKETGTGIVALILMYDRSAKPGAMPDTDGLRLPPGGAWLRANLNGAVYVLASDLVLNLKSIAAWIGGYEPPTT
jgi:hypothetical protein